MEQELLSDIKILDFLGNLKSQLQDSKQEGTIKHQIGIHHPVELFDYKLIHRVLMYMAMRDLGE